MRAREDLMIQPLTGEDFPSLMALEKEAFPLDCWSEEVMRGYFAEAPENFAVIKKDNLVIAYTCVFIHQVELVSGKEEVGELGSLAVLFPYRQLGLGRKLFAWGINRLKQLKAKKIILRTRSDNAAMQSLSENMGFGVNGVIRNLYKGDRDDALEMELRKELI